GWAIRKRRYAEKPDMRYSKTADLLCEMGRYGQKTGAGWYDYQPGKRDAISSPVVNQMIEKHRADLGIKPRKISDDEIVHRLVYSLVNEGAKILEEGIASKASDIDMVYLTGYGFPLHRGGPMCYADQQGLFNVVHTMKKFAANPLDDAAFWQPAPLLARLAEEGKSFT
ncbi:MAG TPA: 3-hydroxyacyl-CoA dehydrogenase family protein, partial [Rubrivivax sp.]|nr:3-hydroxyacyl-CoA dehydrogenase family protein [Rubrivivax sp.]